jgi:hypothetical protein
MDVASGIFWEVLLQRIEWTHAFLGIERVALLDGFLHAGFIQFPLLQTMIHTWRLPKRLFVFSQIQIPFFTARHNVVTANVKISTQDLVSVAFDSAKHGDAAIGLDVPQTKRMIFASGQK